MGRASAFGRETLRSEGGGRPGRGGGTRSAPAARCVRRTHHSQSRSPRIFPTTGESPSRFLQARGLDPKERGWHSPRPGLRASGAPSPVMGSQGRGSWGKAE